MDARLNGPTLTVQDMLSLKPGDLLAFDYPLARPMDLVLNGRQKFHGRVATNGRKRTFLIDAIHQGI